MVDNDTTNVTNDDAAQGDLTTDEREATADHPHAGISSEGWSSPQSDIATPTACFGQLTLKRTGAETDVVFPVNPPAVIGRFDPAMGPIDIDLGNLPEGSYVSRKHAKISLEDGVWKVKDLGSSNGTFILRDDFERVDEAEIKDGDEVAFGNARFVFRTTVPETAMAETSNPQPVNVAPDNADPQS